MIFKSLYEFKILNGDKNGIKCKVVGLSYHKVDNPVTSGDTVYLMAESNKYDNDAIEVFNKEDELLGYVANSDKTLSPQNRANGNKSALSPIRIGFFKEVLCNR